MADHLESIADFAGILEQVGVAVIVIDTDGTMLSVNSASTSMFGYTCEQMLGMNVSMLMPRHHAVHHDGYLKHYLHTREARIIGKGRQVEGLRADGAVFPLHLSVGQCELRGKGCFIGIIHDLSEQVQVRDEVSRLGRIIEQSSNEIYVFSSDTLKFTLVNRGALANLGYSQAQMLQMTLMDIRPECDEAAFRRLVEPLLAGKTDQVTLQGTHLRRDGTCYETDIVLHLAGSGAPVEFVAIVQDCTERNRMRKAVQLSQKMDSIGHLTGGIAHDFNNLLTVITGNLELLEMSLPQAPEREAERELISEARTASVRGADLTERLLSFARQSILMPKRVNLNDVVLDLSELLKRSVGEQVSFHLNMCPEIWMVKIDQSQIDSTLINLAINARDAMPYGGSLTIETRNRSLSPTEAVTFDLPAGNYAELCVTDTGTGIEPANLASIFDPFFTTKPKGCSHGLGLSIVYGFARQSGGNVRVDSVPGQGARFTLLLPRDWSSDDNGVDTVDSAPTALAAAHILLVEDEESVRRLTTRRLLHMGHSVIEASNAQDAVNMYRDHPNIDLLFTDMVMPGKMSGLDLAYELRKTRPDLPVILSSGYSENLNIDDRMHDVRLYLLRKPSSLQELDELLARVLPAKPVVTGNVQ